MGYVEIFVAGVLWAITGPVLRQLKTLGFTPFDAVLGRALFTALILGTVLLVRDIRTGEARALRVLRANFKSVLFVAAIGVLFSQSAYFYALSVTSVAVAVTLNYTAPIFVMLIGWLLFKEPVTRLKVLALFSALLGVALVSGIGTGGLKVSVPGVLAGLLSGLAYGIQTVAYNRLTRSLGPLEINLYTMLFGAPMLSATLWLSGVRRPELFSKILTSPPQATWLLFLLGLGPGSMAFVLFAHGISRVDAAAGSVVAMIEPVAACILGYVILGERLSWMQACGILLVLFALTVVSLAQRRRRDLAASERNSF